MRLCQTAEMTAMWVQTIFCESLFLSLFRSVIFVTWSANLSVRKSSLRMHGNGSFNFLSYIRSFLKILTSANFSLMAKCKNKKGVGVAVFHCTRYTFDAVSVCVNGKREPKRWAIEAKEALERPNPVPSKLLAVWPFMTPAGSPSAEWNKELQEWAPPKNLGNFAEIFG